MTKETQRQTNNTLSFPIGTTPDGRNITADFLHVPHMLGLVRSGPFSMQKRTTNSALKRGLS